MNTSWSENGVDFSPVEATTLTPRLPLGVFKIKFDPQRGFWLTKMSENFSFPHKIYGLERGFIDRVLRTYAGTKGNLGVLADGFQGAGKTLALKVMANELQLPVILVESNLGKGMTDFLSTIQQDIVVFCDEYEKVFKSQSGSREAEDQDSTLLTLMDGVMKTEHRKVFLLTTNRLYINENMLQRPGRIRYKKNFGNLSRQVIEEIVDDMLLWPELREQTVHFIAKLEMITVDIVTSLISEVNIHKEDPDVFADCFNVKLHKSAYDIFWMKGDGTEEVLARRAEIPGGIENLEVYGSLQGSGKYYGEVEDVLENGCVLITPHHVMKRTIFKDEDEVTLRLEAVQTYHSSYANAF